MELQAGGALPDLVVSLGSAGSRRLKRTEVYQVSSVAYRDMDASAFGFEKGVTPFLDLPATLPLPIRIPGVKEASMSTGASIIAGAAFDAIGEDMVDMETFACLRACQAFGVPLVGLRGISDGDADVRPYRRLAGISAHRRRETRRRRQETRSGDRRRRASSFEGPRNPLRQLTLFFKRPP